MADVLEERKSSKPFVKPFAILTSKKKKKRKKKLKESGFIYDEG